MAVIHLFNISIIKRSLVIVGLISGLFNLQATQVNAIYDPKSVPNNKFGIHIADPNDLPEVKSLVNSSGGDWGYVTVVIPDSDKNSAKWQEIFNQMRRLHLIPLVRLATHMSGNAWVTPKPEDITDWITFLNSLNWPIINRYVILFNEPNHAPEWGNSLNPEEYSDYARDFAMKLKKSDQDYYLLPAGMDSSATNTYETMDEADYWSRVLSKNPDFFDYFDGLTSHSYPNPAFSGSPLQSGRGTLKSYIWELNFLSGLGVNKNLPVFITETGWTHSEGKVSDYRLLTPEQLSDYYSIAANSVWQDARIVCVTPFVFSYQDVPFDHFSWKKIGSSDYYPFFNAYQSIAKVSGSPLQYQKYILNQAHIPLSLVAGSNYTLHLSIKNSGQDIVDPNNGYQIVLSDRNSDFKIEFPAPYIEPGQNADVDLNLVTPDKITILDLTINIGRPDNLKTLLNAYVRIIPPPKIQIDVQLGWRRDSSSANTKVYIFNIQGKLISQYTSLNLQKGKINIPNIHHIIPDDKYRIVLVIPNYLPRQVVMQLAKNTTYIKMPRFYPFDIDDDGKLSINDLKQMIFSRPNDIWQLIY